MRTLLSTIILIVTLSIINTNTLVAQDNTDNNIKKEKPTVNGNSKYEETTFKVDGVCDMCKTRIQNAAYSVKGVRKANWDAKTKQLTIKYKKGLDLDKVHTKISEAGHDTDKMKASEVAYNKLHSCCKYRDI